MYQRDIAKELGVSQTTVSLVLKNPKTERISEQKRNKILNYLKEKKYFIQSRREKSGTIDLILTPYTVDSYRSFSGQFVKGIQSAAADVNYNVIISEYRDDLVIPNAKVDGVVLHDAITREKMDELARSMPLVLLNGSVDHADFDMICPDNSGGINLAIEHLLNYGHSRIAYFAVQSPKENPDSNFLERLNGFYAGCRNHGVRIRNEFVQLPEMSDSLSAVESNTLKYWFNLTEPPTAVICCNDQYALFMIQQANILGIKIPDQLSIIGTDSIEAGKMSWPSLTSIDFNAEEMGRLSFEVLMKRIKNPQRPPSRISCLARLEVRESVARCTNI